MEKHIYSEMEALEKDHWWFTSRRNLFSKLFSKFINKKQNKILEIGPGTGGNYSFLSGFGEYQSLECSEEGVRFLKEKNIPVIEGCLTQKQDFKDKYDTVCMFDVLEHIEKDHRALNEIYNTILKEDGKVILSVPAFKFLWSKHDEEHHHFRRYSKKEIEEKLKQAGFEIEFSRYFYKTVFPIAMASKLINKNKTSQMKPENRFINRFLKEILKAEAEIITGHPLNFFMKFFPGTSIVIVAKKL